MQYYWAILQDGQLRLKVNGSVTAEAHLCTVTVLWPRRASANLSHRLIVDPCFSLETIGVAERRLSHLGFRLHEIGYFVETHSHFDHKVSLPHS